MGYNQTKVLSQTITGVQWMWRRGRLGPTIVVKTEIHLKYRGIRGLTNKP